jgi:hypothetical protein
MLTLIVNGTSVAGKFVREAEDDDDTDNTTLANMQRERLLFRNLPIKWYARKSVFSNSQLDTQ